MKRVLSALVLILFVGLASCHSKGKNSNQTYFSQNGKIKVLCTTAMIHDLVKEVGGSYIDSIALITGDVDPHSYELVKGDDEKIQFADLVVGNGLHLEHGASLAYHLSHHPHALLLGEEIQKKVPEKILWIDGQIDPHVWMDVSLWAEGVDAIANVLSALLPDAKDELIQNGLRLKQEMLDVHQEIFSQLQQIPSKKRYLVTSHDAFHYFASAYLKDDSTTDRCVAPEGLAPEGQLSSQDIQRVIDHLLKYEVSVVFPESNVSKDALRKIISSCKHEVKICPAPLYGDAMGVRGSSADTYLKMMEHNAQVMQKAWEL